MEFSCKILIPSLFSVAKFLCMITMLVLGQYLRYEEHYSGNNFAFKLDLNNKYLSCVTMDRFSFAL